MKFAIKSAFLLLLLSVIFCSCQQKCRHDNLDVSVIAPTCTESGYTLNKCIDCGKTFSTDHLDPYGHLINSSVTPPTCDKQGYTENSCSCGYSYISDYVKPLKHEFTVSKVTPTCDYQGYTVHICKKCNYQYIDEYIASTEHEFTITTVESTCTNLGYTLYSCDCGFEYKADNIATQKHTYSAYITEPSCENSGFTTYTCDDCGFTYTSEYTQPIGHIYSKSTTTATCTESGFTVNTCECGHTVISEYTSALGHDIIETTIFPTVTNIGYTEFSCTVCSFSYIDNYLYYDDILPNGAYASDTTVLARGVDVSKWNHTVGDDQSYISLDWASIKNEGVDYVIIKAGSGKNGIDPTFNLDYYDAKAAGLDVGVYFYTYATNLSEIIADAELLLSILDGKQFEYPIYLDLEDESIRSVDKSTLTEMCIAFFSILQGNGYYTGLYINHEWLYNVLETEKMLEMFDIWYARYPQNVEEYVWNVETYGQPFGMWQYSDKGALSAIPNININFSFSYKDYPTIIKALGLNGY